MNDEQILILKEALEKIEDELYEQLPLTYADKASNIIKTVFDNIIKKYFKLFE